MTLDCLGCRAGVRGGGNVIPGDLIGEGKKQKGQSQRFPDAAPLALRTEAGAAGQGGGHPVEARQGKERTLPPSVQEEHSPESTLR